MGVRSYLAMIAGAVLLAAPAAAQPDFAAAFQRLDANSDGVIAVGELRHQWPLAKTTPTITAAYWTAAAARTWPCQTARRKWNFFIR